MSTFNTVRLTALAAGALLLLAACGGSSSSSSDTATTSPSVAASAPAGAIDMSAYRDCMAANGVTLPEFVGRADGDPNGMPSGMPTGTPPSGMPAGGPGGPGFAGRLPDGVDQETFDAAQTACADLAPQGGFAQRGPGGGGQIDETAIAAYKSCLTDHHVTIPEGDNWIAALDRSDPTVQAAAETCAPLLPVPGSPAPAPAPTSNSS